MPLAVVLCLIAACKSNAPAPVFVDDAQITQQVKAALSQDPQLVSRQIEVQTFNGRVTLSGIVDTSAMAQRAQREASRVAGVREVENALRVAARPNAVPAER
ncbi:MAG TPA: BON domain-containing protein [Steroidobacteraceae bacterium]|nr:BON domain-containing protein [Steroidobacteraceae bacterium]